MFLCLLILITVLNCTCICSLPYFLSIEGQCAGSTRQGTQTLFLRELLRAQAHDYSEEWGPTAATDEEEKDSLNSQAQGLSV